MWEVRWAEFSHHTLKVTSFTVLSSRAAPSWAATRSGPASVPCPLGRSFRETNQITISLMEISHDANGNTWNLLQVVPMHFRGLSNTTHHHLFCCICTKTGKKKSFLLFLPSCHKTGAAKTSHSSILCAQVSLTKSFESETWRETRKSELCSSRRKYC